MACPPNSIQPCDGRQIDNGAHALPEHLGDFVLHAETFTVLTRLAAQVHGSSGTALPECSAKIRALKKLASREALPGPPRFLAKWREAALDYTAKSGDCSLSQFLSLTDDH